MFQLIVAVISIALVAALAIASIYYGGSAFQKSSLKANVTALVNGGQQISGAQALYVTDFGVPVVGSSATDTAPVATLVSGVNGTTYLSAPPSVSQVAPGGNWGIVAGGSGNGIAVIPLVQTNIATVCAEVTRQAGAKTQATNAQFYCSTAAGTADGTASFAFKL